MVYHFVQQGTWIDDMFIHSSAQTDELSERLLADPHVCLQDCAATHCRLVISCRASDAVDKARASKQFISRDCPTLPTASNLLEHFAVAM